MATLHKFKLFAAQSPTRSPLVQLRRPRTTLRMLLSGGRRRESPSPSLLHREHVLEKKGKDLMRRHSLKDLFVSSPPREEKEMQHASELGSVGNIGLGFGSVTWGDGHGSAKSGWTGFRYRSLLKRKTWRPLLLAVPEDEESTLV